SFEHRDHVVSAAARDNVLTARRYACRVDAVSNAATGHLESLQDVIRTGQCRTAAERAEKVLQHLRSLQHALSKGRNAHRDSRIVEPFERNVNDAVAAAARDVEIVIRGYLHVRVQMYRKLGAAAPYASDLRRRKIDLVDVLAHHRWRPLDVVLVIRGKGISERVTDGFRRMNAIVPDVILDLDDSGSALRIGLLEIEHTDLPDVVTFRAQVADQHIPPLRVPS